MYSNIPIRISKNEWSEVMSEDHLLLRKRIPERAVVFIDEFGAVASQWDFDNPLVMEQLTNHTRLARHYYDPKWFVCDQVSDNIVKPVRTRLGVIYYLYDFGRVWGFLPWVKVSCVPLLGIEDTATRMSEEFDRFFITFRAYKWMEKLGLSKKRFDSRCYSELYYSPAVKDLEHHNGYKTRYLMDFGVDESTRKDYKLHRDKYRKYLYNKEEIKIAPPEEEKRKTLGDLWRYIKSKLKRRDKT